MKPIWLAGIALLALVALEPAAQAQRVNFTYTGKLVTYTVPATGLYQITAYGAQGGSVVFSTGVGQGGLGAEIGGDFTLTAKEVLQIAVGGSGTSNGGGGGSFVVGPDDMPLVIAGGGGGTGYDLHDNRPFSGYPGLTTENAGGTNGNGGKAVPFGLDDGGGGGGFLTAGGSALYGPPNLGVGGGAFPSLLGGASGGGFGGGGGGDVSGGGGGGYSGGNGGAETQGGYSAGGGGGSYDAGTNQILKAGIQTGDGEVVINTIFVGTPGKPNCHGEVVSNLAKQYGGLDAAAAALGYSSVQVLQNGIATYCGGSIG